MQLGMIGLGRMGANMVRRLTKNGRQCAVYDPKAIEALAKEKVTSHGETDFAGKLLSAMRYEFGGPIERPAGG